MSVFEYESYKDWLHFKIDENQNVRGYQSRLSESAGCQRSYLSQVLRGSQHLTIEHGHGLCLFWGFSALETEYYLTLILREKAGTSALKKVLGEKLKTLSSDSKKISKRLKTASLSLTADDKAKYYSEWYWSAVHMALSVVDLDTAEKISVSLGLPVNLVTHVLVGLKEMGLVEQDNHTWKKTAGSIHLDQDSPFVHQHHRNWRSLPSEFYLEKPGGSLNKRFSAVFSLSYEDYEKLQNFIVDFVEQCSEVVSSSEPEKLASLAIDLVSVSGKDR